MSELDDILKNIPATDRGGETTHKTADDAFQDLLASVEVPAAQRCADFLDKMFSTAYFSRSNSKKSACYQILCSALASISVHLDDKSTDELYKLVARAEVFLYSGNQGRFRDAIVHAFSRSKFAHFSDLADAIRQAETEQSIRRTALSMRVKRERGVADWNRIAQIRMRKPKRR